MKEDRDLLKELLQSKLKDDFIKPSTKRFDDVFETVQEERTSEGTFLWYKIAAAILILISIGGVFTYIMNKNSFNDPIKKQHIVDTPPKEKIDSTTLKEKPILKQEKKKPITQKKVLIANEEPENPKPKKDNKKDNSQISENDKSKIDVSYVTTKKYASTKFSKFIKLPDTSTIIMQKSSRVDYKRSIKNYRTVNLIGNVFFDVKKDTTKPFIVIGNHARVRVTGTTFVMSSGKDGDYLTLIEGSVDITHIETGKKQTVFPGQSYEVNNQGISLLNKSPNQFAWKTGNLSYQNTDVNKIIEDLEKNFDIKIRLQNETLRQCKYTGSFRKTTAEKVLYILATTLKVEIEKKNNLFIIKGDGNCID